MSGRVEWVLTALEQARVRYLVVGGVALVLHGYLRTTLHLDLVLQLERDNLERALKAFGDLGFLPSRDDLLEMKRSTGRARDVEDIEALSQLPRDES